MQRFIIIWIGQVFSNVGSGMFCLAQAIWVYTDLGGSITTIAMISLAARLPGLLISPIAGALVDRWSRKKVMIISDSIAAAATVSLHILVVTDSYELWHLFAITAIISMTSHFQWPAFFATVPLLVPKSQLGAANGLIQVGQSITAIAGPLLGGIIVTVFSIQGVILFDLASYLVGIATLLVVAIPRPAGVSAQGALTTHRLKNEVLDGWSYLAKRRGLLYLFSFFGISNLFFHVTGFLIIPFALSFTGATVLGSTLAMGGLGMLAGSLLMTIWGGPRMRIHGVLGFMMIQTVTIVVFAFQSSPAALVAAYIVFAATVPFINACSSLLWQSKVSPEFHGRVMAISAVILNIAPALALAVAGPLADAFEVKMAIGGAWSPMLDWLVGSGDGRGIAFMFLVMGLIGIVVTLSGVLSPRLLRIDTELPDQLPTDIDVAEPPLPARCSEPSRLRTRVSTLWAD